MHYFFTNIFITLKTSLLLSFWLKFLNFDSVLNLLNHFPYSHFHMLRYSNELHDISELSTHTLLSQVSSEAILSKEEIHSKISSI